MQCADTYVNCESAIASSNCYLDPWRGYYSKYFTVRRFSARSASGAMLFLPRHYPIISTQKPISTLSTKIPHRIGHAFWSLQSGENLVCAPFSTVNFQDLQRVSDHDTSILVVRLQLLVDTLAAVCEAQLWQEYSDRGP